MLNYANEFAWYHCDREYSLQHLGPASLLVN
jgi:hypothetical protein